MWEWKHLEGESWLAHTKRSAKFSGLLLLAGCAMVLHMVVPFWQQPLWLRAPSVACTLCEDMKKKGD